MIEQTKQAQAATYTNWEDVLYRFKMYADRILVRRYGMDWDSFPDLVAINSHVKQGMTNEEIKAGAIKACEDLITKVKAGY
jgi:hypothetical protein